MNQIIIDNFNSLWAQEEWNFKIKQEQLTLLPDISDPEIEIEFDDSYREIRFSDDVPELIAYRRELEGNYIYIEGRAYEILQILDARTLITVEPVRTLDGSTPLETNTWVIKQFRLYLPADCERLLDCQYPQNQQRGGTNPLTLAALTAKSERMWNRLVNEEGQPQGYVHEPPIRIPGAQKLAVVQDSTMDELPGTGIEFEQFIELAWAFEGPTGQQGGLSDPLKFKTEALNQGRRIIEVQFLTHDNKPVESLVDYTPGPTRVKRPWEGLRKVVYYNSNIDRTTGRRLGPPAWIPVSNGVGEFPDDHIRAQDTESSIEITMQESFAPQEHYYLYSQPTQVIRLFPRPNNIVYKYDAQAEITNGPSDPVIPARPVEYFARVNVTYYRRAPNLALQTDSHWLPIEMIQCVVHRTANTMALKAGDSGSSQIAQNNYTLELRTLKKNYLTQGGLIYRKGRWNRATGQVRFGKIFYDV